MGQRKNVKLGDIAQALNVSIVTVSNALKGKKGSRRRTSFRNHEEGTGTGISNARTCNSKRI